MIITRQQITTELERDGYQPFLRTVVGSVVNAEAWTHRPGTKRMVIVLYRKDTGELFDRNNIPDDEKNRPDLIAFLDDFGQSVFCPH